MFMVALGTIGTAATAFAQPQPPGIDVADVNVHENTGLASNPDVRFHEGLCQAGISTAVLDTLQGCATPIITAPGESDEVRQDQ